MCLSAGGRYRGVSLTSFDKISTGQITPRHTHHLRSHLGLFHATAPAISMQGPTWVIGGSISEPSNPSLGHFVGSYRQKLTDL